MLQIEINDLNKYLQSSDIIDFQNELIQSTVEKLSNPKINEVFKAGITGYI